MAPVLIAAFGLAIACLIQAWPYLFSTSANSGDSRFDLFQRIEWMTYDLRVRLARKFPRPTATNMLAAVLITDEDIKRLNDGSFGYHVKFPWPLHFYGRVVHELKAQGAAVIGFDILFDQLSRNAMLPEEPSVASDDFFAEELRKAGNVVLACEIHRRVFPHPLFATNCLAIGDISAAQRDFDNVLRRVKAFHTHRVWHQVVRERAQFFEFDFDNVRYEPGQIVLPSTLEHVDPLVIPLRPDGSIDRARADHLDLEGEDPQMPYHDIRIWDMGFVLAARLLKLDLEHAQIRKDMIILRNEAGLEKRIPVDEEGNFYIDWSIALGQPGFHEEKISFLVSDYDWRRDGMPPERPEERSLKGRIVIIGSVATGSNAADLGATPLSPVTPLVTRYWNVANSILTGSFVVRSGFWTELLLILLLGSLSATVTWRLRVVQSSLVVLAIAVVYAAVGTGLFVMNRYWLALALPIGGGVFLPHFLLVSYRLGFEQRERRRIRSVFSKIVSPAVVNELLNAEKLSLGGAVSELTVLFADIRGFTEYTDSTQLNAEEFARQHRLEGKEMEAYLGEQARETLGTVNCYLSLVAEMVIKHGGTLDKYIGDCVMAFWGAPVSNPRHAVAAVRAAIEAQRGIFALNQQRREENRRREEENQRRAQSGVPPLPLLPILSLGTGISTGKVIVGLMGSDSHILNYTVFGREVNLASRLESVSGHGRIIIGEATYAALRRDAPALAERCIEQTPVMVKGIRGPVRNFEVPWSDASLDAGGEEPTSQAEKG